ncbi:MAG TPA: lysophospholipid acyltransferase family protein [Gaiellaceae bacterium]|nr:lysophospholipid acyltransferase family protein [Gaiellaceae bacterium]
MTLYRLLDAVGFRPVMKALYRIELTGAERIPAEGLAILAANHESLIDPFVLGTVTTRRIRYLAKAELWRNPLLARVMDAFGTFPVERGTGDSAALGRAARLLAEGEILGIFPQGTCLPYRRRPYMRGAARLALATGAPLVPVRMVGTERALRPGRFRIGLPKIRILVGEPIRVGPERPTVASARALTAALEAMIAELGRPYGEPRHAWRPA